MKLKEFIENYVEKNTLIRLWHPIKGGHIMVGKYADSLSMAWQILKEEGIYKDYGDKEVIGVVGIVVNKTAYPEAVNIVIEK